VVQVRQQPAIDLGEQATVKIHQGLTRLPVDIRNLLHMRVSIEGWVREARELTGTRLESTFLDSAPNRQIWAWEIAALY
jgi:hypothetical protein